MVSAGGISRLVLGATTLWLFPGCIVVPFPNSRVEGYGVASQVLDLETRLPVADARVVDATDNRRVARTDHDGKFRLDPIVQRHWVYLWGVLSYPIWPFTTDIPLPERSIRIVAPGYEDAQFELTTLRKNSPDDLKLLLLQNLANEHDVLMPNVISIRRRPDGSEH